MNQWLTMSQAARACGRVPGGNIHRLMMKWNVMWKRENGHYFYGSESASTVPHLNRTATQQARDEYIDKQTKWPELPLTVSPTFSPVALTDNVTDLCRQIVSQADGCDYRAKYQELVKRLNELKEG